MRWPVGLVLASAIGLATLGGCANARYVECSAGDGVVAIPANTNSWPNYYRNHAEELMRQKCPDGYEIVHEGEAVTGQTHDTDTGIIRDSFPMGPSEQHIHQQTRVTDITEWRIIYPPRSNRTVGSNKPAAGRAGYNAGADRSAAGLVSLNRPKG